ncbi:hypothetical protein ACFE04_009809 [Oxalis oulophora]
MLEISFLISHVESPSPIHFDLETLFAPINTDSTPLPVNVHPPAANDPPPAEDPSPANDSPPAEDSPPANYPPPASDPPPASHGNNVILHSTCTEKCLFTVNSNPPLVDCHIINSKMCYRPRICEESENTDASLKRIGECEYLSVHDDSVYALEFFGEYNYLTGKTFNHFLQFKRSYIAQTLKKIAPSTSDKTKENSCTSLYMILALDEMISQLQTSIFGTQLFVADGWWPMDNDTWNDVQGSNIVHSIDTTNII